MPPEHNTAFLCAMENLLEVYPRPYDPSGPVVCMDESRQAVCARDPAPARDAPRQSPRVRAQRNGTRADVLPAALIIGDGRKSHRIARHQLGRRGYAGSSKQTILRRRRSRWLWATWSISVRDACSAARVRVAEQLWESAQHRRIRIQHPVTTMLVSADSRHRHPAQRN